MKKFFKDESGQGMVEYGLIIALVAVALIFAISKLAPAIEIIFGKASNELEGAAAGGPTVTQEGQEG